MRPEMKYARYEISSHHEKNYVFIAGEMKRN